MRLGGFQAQVRDNSFEGRPFDGGVGAMIDEWSEENLCGYRGQREQVAGLSGLLGMVGSVAGNAQAGGLCDQGRPQKRRPGGPRREDVPAVDALGALDRKMPKSPRRLGVTPEMIKWISEAFDTDESSSAQEKFDAAMIKAVVLIAWFSC